MLIYATHSHHLIEPKWLNGTYIVKNNSLNYENEEEFDSNQTDIASILYRQFVASYPNDKNYFQPILDKLEYQPSMLEDVPNIVMTEGKNDFYTFKYVYEVVLENNDDIKFYPGNGVDKLDQIFRLYLAWGRDFVAIFDSDRQGKDAKQNYINGIGLDVENKIFTLVDINTQWDNISTENLFSDEEKLEIIKRFFSTTTYEKSKFNTAVQQLYTEKTRIELSDQTKEKFKQIFEFIKGKL